MVREATLADVPRIVAMGRRFITETGYAARIPVNPTQMQAFVERLIDGEFATVFVADEGGDVIGMIGAFTYQHPISDEFLASEVFWWVEPERRGSGLRLLRAAERWARAKGAVKLQMIAPTPEVERIYAALGYDKVETTYAREL